MSNEIDTNQSSSDLVFSDPLKAFKEGRDKAFTKVTDFGSFFVNMLADIEAQQLSRDLENSRRLAEAGRLLAQTTGERNALSDQVEQLTSRLEHKAPNPEAAEALVKVQSRLTIAETDVKRLTRLHDELSVKHAVAVEERDAALSRLSALLESGDAAELQREIETLRSNLEDARSAGREAVDAGERMVGEAGAEAERRIAEMREELDAVLARSASPEDLASLQRELVEKDAELTRLSSDAEFIRQSAASEASHKAFKTLHALSIQSPHLTLGQSLSLVAVSLGVEAPEAPTPVPDFQVPAPVFEVPMPSFDVPAETLEAPADPVPMPEEQPMPQFDVQPAPVFDLQPAPSFDARPEPETEVKPAAHVQESTPAAPTFGGDFFSTPVTETPHRAPAENFFATPADVQPQAPAENFFAAPNPVDLPDDDRPLTADFFATATPVRADDANKAA